MNILCLVSYNFLPAKMGGQKGIASFYQFYSKKVNLTCVCPKSNSAQEADYEVLNLLSDSASRYINVLYFFTLKKIIKERNITHIQIEHPYYGWLAILLKWFCGIRLIVHSHNIESIRFKSVGKKWWRLLWIYEKGVHRLADFNLFITDEDKYFAIKHFGLVPKKCLTATYGIDWDECPKEEEKELCRDKILQQYQLSQDCLLLLFNGTFSYKPNLDGLNRIIEEINPLLLKSGLPYAIIICGKNIPSQLSEKKIQNIIIEGFVPDIGLYFKAADIFLNPVKDGGGIKTKLVEALGYNLFAISYQDGSIGIPKDVASESLFIANNAEDFANKIVSLKGKKANLSASYFSHFYWGNIINRVIDFLNRKH